MDYNQFVEVSWEWSQDEEIETRYLYTPEGVQKVLADVLPQGCQPIVTVVTMG